MIKPGDTVYYIGGQDEGGRRMLETYSLPRLIPYMQYEVEKTKMETSYSDGIEKWSLKLKGYERQKLGEFTEIYSASFMFKKVTKLRKFYEKILRSIHL